ncbi:cell envelope integrity protein TolA [Citrobacter sp. Cpo107]|uniref:cell envelope integrity protein TolA n=1 Tax=Citrobacter TaxID=544 RepID=UPI00257808BC|nr:cell envelope integrity protein TolA [Citrobacter sp. Cpo107]MDM2807623.1 cell envelope integrity protein TolA [Citrobacter sp. Cpo107]
MLTVVAIVLSGCTPIVPKGCFKENTITNCTFETKAKDQSIYNYASTVRRSIQDKFYDADIYRGKSCVLKVSLEKDGTLTDVHSEEGDPALCEAAIAATKYASFPAMTEEQYKVFHSFNEDFKL